MMHVLLTSVGTDGDILPCLRLGEALAGQGVRVTLAAAGSWQGRAEQAGLAFAPLVTEEENAELFHHPDFWNPWKTATLSARWGVRFLERQYRLLSGLTDERTVIVANPAVFAAGLVHEKRGTPLISLALQPWIFPSVESPPVMPVAPLPPGTPKAVWRLLWESVGAFGDGLTGPPLNRLRARLGLPPARRILFNWWSRQLVLGLFPPWYGPPQSDWPQAVRLTSFPLPAKGGQGTQEQLPAALEQFCQEGRPPVAFTWGTGMSRPERFFAAAAEACRISGRRGIFLTRFPEALPSGLPPEVLVCGHAPFEMLFPRCAAVVHHGGIGTASAALAAGIPQLVCPVSFDQPDNAARLAKLGVAESLPPRRLNGPCMSAALDRLESPAVRTACREVSHRLSREAGLHETVDAILKFAAAHFLPEENRGCDKNESGPHESPVRPVSPRPAGEPAADGRHRE